MIAKPAQWCHNHWNTVCMTSHHRAQFFYVCIFLVVPEQCYSVETKVLLNCLFVCLFHKSTPISSQKLRYHTLSCFKKIYIVLHGCLKRNTCYRLNHSIKQWKAIFGRFIIINDKYHVEDVFRFVCLSCY